MTSSPNCRAARAELAEGFQEPPIIAERLPALDTSWRVRLHGLILGMCVVVVLLSAILEVRESRWVFVPGLEWRLPESCSLRRTFGIACPGCGMTRGFIATARGDLRAAWTYNAAAIPLFVWLVTLIPYQVMQLDRIRRGRYPLTMGNWAVVPLSVLTALMLGHWIWRALGT